MLKIKKGSIVSKVISIMLTFLMCVSSCQSLVFADEPVKYGGWTVTNDGTSSGVAVFDGMDLTYYSPSSQIIKYSSATIDEVEYASVRSNSSNGAATNGIVTINNSTRGYIKYVPTADGTFTTWVGSAPTKLAVVSKTNNETNESTAIGTFYPCGTDPTVVVNEGEMEVIQEASYATLNIEVKAGYTYYYCVTGSKMGCFGGKFVPYTKVTGKINDEFNISDFGIKFTNLETKEVFTATVDKEAKTYSISLKPNYSYSVGLTGSAAASYGLSKDTRTVTPTGTEMTADVTVEQSTNYTVSGSISGIASGYNTSDFDLVFVPKDVNDFVSVDAEIDKTNMTYSAMLVANEEYTLVQKGAFDYELAEKVTVVNEDEKPVSKDIAFKDVATFDVSGKFIGLTQERGVYEDLTSVAPTEIKFTNITDKYKYEYTYSGTPKAGSYSAKLRKGDYLATITCENYSTTTHVIVDDSAVSRDLLLKYEGAVSVPFSETLYVGADKDYKTVSAAVSAVSNMTRTNNERVTIKIDPGEYREQVYVTVPNITLESNGGNRDNTKITWYYGIGYKYYSTVESIYNPYADYDKYEKGDVIKYWGSAVITTGTATGFNAKNICFENSFNKYMTDEEIVDGVEVNGRESIKVVRKETTVVDSKAATERAAAYVNYADQTEFLNCSFIGSQDTLYTCNVNYKAYYKNCYIEGMTDYIYGNGDVIFDGCELNWGGYSDTAAGGYITAQSASEQYNCEFGYVFRNCFVSANKDRLVGQGSFGRMWGKCATVNFINTQLQSENLINSDGWSAMSGNSPTMETVKLQEFNTTFNGEKVDTSKRVAGVVETIDADKYTVKNAFVDKGWTPNYYVEESSATPEIIEGPAFTSNGDINAPNPGETLTVNYKLTDGCLDSNTSRIAWYAVSTDFDNTSLETILKSATLLDVTTSYISNDKYQIPMECAGKYIMAVVTPITVGGKQGTAKYEIDTTKAVSDTWINPDNQGELAPGEGINIFLAGDSTVKDYSAKGMYQGGKINNLGSWGEFFQKFFNEDAVTINNYANGGRSLRNFLNEGSLDKIINNISEGDFLLIQFGHNDCANGASYYSDRFVPLYAEPNGTDVVDGIYPTVVPTESMKGADGKFAWNCGATYKGYMQYYIDEAIKKGAVPVIVSPVVRMYYTSEGTIKNHHDSTATDYEPTSTYRTSGDAYVTACEQLYQENVKKGNTIYYIDAFDLTKTMFEDAWKACGNNTNGSAMMGVGDGTHCNKVGGVLEAGLIAQALQGLNVSASKYVVQPTVAYGELASGDYIFTVKNKVFTALNNDLVKNDYVTEYGQKLFDAIGNAKVLGDDYAVSGKTNLTSGTLKISDSNGTEVATAEIKADGTYSFKITSSSSIAGKTYKAKVDGYKEVELTLTVSETDEKAFVAVDVTFEAYATASGVIGDADNDGEVSVNDASLVLGKVLKSGKVLPVEVAEDYMKYIDVNGDNRLTSVDAAMILEKALDKSFEF